MLRLKIPEKSLVIILSLHLASMTLMGDAYNLSYVAIAGMSSLRRDCRGVEREFGNTFDSPPFVLGDETGRQDKLRFAGALLFF